MCRTGENLQKYLGAESGVYHVELRELPPRYFEGEGMDAVFDSDDGGAKSRQLLKGCEITQMLFDCRFHSASKVLIWQRRHGELKSFETMKGSRWDCEKGLYSMVGAKCARKRCRAPRHGKNPILDNVKYLVAISGPGSVYVREMSRLKEKKG